MFKILNESTRHACINTYTLNKLNQSMSNNLFVRFSGRFVFSASVHLMGFTRFEKLIMVRPLAVFLILFSKFNCFSTLHSRCSKNNTWLHTHSRWSNKKNRRNKAQKNTHKTRKNYVQTISFVFSYVKAIKCIKNYWLALKVFAVCFSVSRTICNFL